MKIKTHESCDLSIDEMKKIFKQRGYDLAVINNSDRETLIAHDDKSISYLRFPPLEETLEVKEDELVDKLRKSKISYINTFVNKCIGKYIKNAPPEVKFMDHRGHEPFDLFIDRVEPFEFNDTPETMSHIAYFDIKHAYLQVAYKLGYFDRKSYFKLLKLYPDYKLEICSALTSLSKRIQCTYYKKGSVKKVDRVVDCSFYGISGIRNNIIDATNFIMYKYCEENKIKVYVRNVDSVIINKRDAYKLSNALNANFIKHRKIEGIYLGGNVLRAYDGTLHEIGDCLKNNITKN